MNYRMVEGVDSAGVNTAANIHSGLLKCTFSLSQTKNQLMVKTCKSPQETFSSEKNSSFVWEKNQVYQSSTFRFEEKC